LTWGGEKKNGVFSWGLDGRQDCEKRLGKKTHVLKILGKLGKKVEKRNKQR